jgi:hypothetical protein
MAIGECVPSLPPAAWAGRASVAGRWLYRNLATRLLLSAALAASGFGAWRHCDSAEPPAKPEVGTAQPAPGAVTITPLSCDAWEAFAELARKGGPEVLVFGGRDWLTWG